MTPVLPATRFQQYYPVGTYYAHPDLLGHYVHPDKIKYILNKSKLKLCVNSSKRSIKCDI
jgi:hypothetical protein